MNDRHPGESDGKGAAVPRDLPDQTARPGEDPLDVRVEGLGSSGEPDPDPGTGPDPDREGDLGSDDEEDVPEDPDQEPDQESDQEIPDPELPDIPDEPSG
ncbi:hypothetical protein [Streptomyces sp. NPDC058665]|uniref:hypothetical protein n=1 Tax=Streptomyces sp. NPDC058665 TaxID=3346586 RepID=UPI003651DCDC